jgi:RNA recognition motif-containing protein
MVASEPNQQNTNNPYSSSNKKSMDMDQERFLRLFIIINPQSETEDTLRQEFIRYGDLENISIIRDRQTKEGKGFAYIKFRK